jgi:hypothetical protein
MFWFTNFFSIFYSKKKEKSASNYYEGLPEIVNLFPEISCWAILGYLKKKCQFIFPILLEFLLVSSIVSLLCGNSITNRKGVKGKSYRQ